MTPVEALAAALDEALDALSMKAAIDRQGSVAEQHIAMGIDIAVHELRAVRSGFDVVPTGDAGPVVCVGHCGSLDWTLADYGVITHKHSCPRRTTTFCQSHRDGCPPTGDAALDVERHSCAFVYDNGERCNHGSESPARLSDTGARR